jgi:predicted aspartyl protease
MIRPDFTLVIQVLSRYDRRYSCRGPAVRRNGCFLLRWLTLVGFAAALPLGQAAATCTLSSLTTIPLTIAGSRLYVPVSMNETQGLFLVDTGSQLTLLTSAFAAQSHVGLDRHAGQEVLSGLGGRETLPVNMAHARRIDVGKIAFNDWEFAVVPPEAGGLGKTAHEGILGMDFLHYFDIDMDLAAGTLTLWRLTGCKDIYPEWKGDYDAIPLKHTPQQSVTIPIFIDNAFLDVAFDTGADGAWLTHSAAARAGATDAMLAKDAESGAGGIGGRVPAVNHRFQLLMVGSGQFPNPTIGVESETSRREYVDGLVGWRFLNARKIWISYATDTLFVQPLGK